jgi:hypothetical protein
LLKVDATSLHWWPANKRSGSKRGAGCSSWLRGEPIVSDSDGRVGFCLVPE